MQPRRVRKTGKALITILAVLIAAPIAFPGYAQSLEGTNKALTWYESLTEKWEQILDPLARRQAARAIRRISNNLDDLALDKQELTEKLLDAGQVPDHVQITASIQRFKETTQRLRRNFKDFSSILPSEYQAQGDEVADALHTSLSEKWQTLNDLSQALIGDEFDPKKIAKESQILVEKLRELSSKFDELAGQVDSGVSNENTRQFLDWLRRESIETLNVAGPRESKRPGIYSLTHELLDRAVKPA